MRSREKPVPVYRNHKLSGSLVALIKVSAITDMFIDKIKVGETGYAFVMEKDGPVIAYPDKSKILKDISEGGGGFDHADS